VLYGERRCGTLLVVVRVLLIHCCEIVGSGARILSRRITDVRRGEKAPRILRGALDPILWHTWGAGVRRVWPDSSSGPSEARAFCQLVQGELVELTGFEPVTPSLRKMRSKRCDQGERPSCTSLWGGCGASDVRQGKT
jgi:hypothetical protein